MNVSKSTARTLDRYATVRKELAQVRALLPTRRPSSPSRSSR